MNSNKKINLLVDAVKLALIIFIACADRVARQR